MRMQPIEQLAVVSYLVGTARRDAGKTEQDRPAAPTKRGAGHRLRAISGHVLIWPGAWLEPNTGAAGAGRGGIDQPTAASLHR
jgi:hypothetical protein